MGSWAVGRVGVSADFFREQSKSKKNNQGKGTRDSGPPLTSPRDLSVKGGLTSETEVE